MVRSHFPLPHKTNTYFKIFLSFVKFIDGFGGNIFFPDIFFIFLLCFFGALPWDLFVGLLVSGFIFKVLVALIDTPLLYLGVYLFRKKFNLEINEEIDI